MPFIWVIGYFLGGVTVSGTSVLRYSNSQTVISNFIFLLFIAVIIIVIFYIFSKIKSNSNNNDSKNKYLSKSNSNINVNTEKQINKKNITVSKMSNKVMEINAEEEEEIYAKVSKEFSSEDRKEGAWTKALIQSDGDENKAKITYMKLRVEILKNELIELKIQKENIIIREKEESLIFEKLDNQKSSIMNQLDYLIKFYKKYKIDNKELIPIKFIEYLTTKYNPAIHTGEIFPELLELVRASKAKSVEESNSIPLEVIEEIYYKYRWNT